MILRTCANNDCEYEWGVHVAGFAIHVSFTEEQIRSTHLGNPDSPCWGAGERMLLLAVENCAGRAPWSHPWVRIRSPEWERINFRACVEFCVNADPIC